MDSSVPWRLPAMLTATLFLNFVFCFFAVRDFPVLALIGAAGVIVALFYCGPAFATQASGRSLLDLAAVSFGTIPAFGLRFCCAFYVVTWVLGPISAIAWGSPFPALLTVYLLLAWIALRSIQEAAGLAVFTNKLMIAI